MIKLNTKEQSQKETGNFVGIISIGIFIVQGLLILNCFFKLTPFQELEGMSLLLAPIVSLIGVILGIIAFKQYYNRLTKIGIIGNSILFFLPFLYFFFGTLIFGP